MLLLMYWMTDVGAGPPPPFDNIQRNLVDRIMHPIQLDIEDPWDEKNEVL